MSNKNFYVNDVLKDMASKLKTVCSNVFPINRPASVGEQMKEFLVVRLSYTMRDRNPYATANFRVEIYVREKETGIANSARMDTLINKVTDLFPMQDEEGRYTAHRPYLSISGSDGLGFTGQSLNGKIIINTTDRY